jgi:hypothetical protein
VPGSPNEDEPTSNAFPNAEDEVNDNVIMADSQEGFPNAEKAGMTKEDIGRPEDCTSKLNIFLF